MLHSFQQLAFIAGSLYLLLLLQFNAINGSYKCIFISESENVSCT